MKLLAPWTKEQVDALQRWQECDAVHPFTCGQDGRVLTPTPDGWVCPREGCSYTQNWAHEGMLELPGDLDPFGTLYVWAGRWVLREDAERWAE